MGRSTTIKLIITIGELMLKSIILSLGLLINTNAFALFESQGTVKSIKANGGKIIFNVCSSVKCDSFYLIADSDYNKTIISIILTAKMSGKLIWVGGSDTPSEGWPYYGARAFSALDLKG